MRHILSIQGAQPSLSLNGHDSKVDGTHGFVVGVSAPGEIFGLRFAFGAALFLPDDRVSRTRSLANAQPRWQYYDNRTQRIYLAAQNKDFTILQSGVMIVGVVYLVATLIADILYSVFNPRIRFGGVE